jgi:hypothetical protein
MAKGLSADEQANLDETLRSKFGSGLREASSKERRDVTRILKRGAIDNDDDFRLVRNQVEDADKESTFSHSEIELIHNRLVAYEVAKRER